MKVSMDITEAGRANILREYNILDTAPERAFDEINRLAAYICGTPIALLSLIDSTRQWFKSKMGLEASEIARDISFCTYTIQQAELVIIRDTLADKRFASHPWVTSDTNIRFYAGMPLITPEGYALGTLCVMDRVPRKLSLQQEEALRALGCQVAAQLELRRNLAEHKRMQEALQQAHAELELRVEERTTELRHANEQLQSEMVEHQRLDLQLRRREQELADFFDNGVIGLHWVGPDGTILWANQAELDLLGYSCKEYIGHHIANFHADQSVIEDILRRLAAQETLKDYEARLLCKDGSIRYVLIDSNVFWEDGQFIHTRCFTRDITDRKRAEEKLSFQAHLLDVVGQAVIATDLEGAIIYWNRFAEELYGWSADEVLGRSIVEVTPARAWEDHALTIMKQLEAGEIWSGEFLVQRRDGSTFPVFVTDSPVHNDQGVMIGIIGVSKDISDLKRTEAALRQSEERFRSLSACSPVGVFLTNTEGHCIYANPRWEAISGFTFAEAQGEGWVQSVYPEDWERVFTNWSVHVQSGWEYADEFRLQTKAGTVRWVYVRSSPMFSNTGELMGHVGTTEDITDRKQAEEALQRARNQLEIQVQERTRELARANEELKKEIAERKLIEQELMRSNERFQLAASAVSCVIYDWDIQKNNIERTTGLVNVLGYPPEEAQPSFDWWVDRIHPDDRQHTCQQISLALSQGSDFAVEYRVCNRSNQYQYVWDRGIIVRNSDGRAIRVIGSFLDITPRKRAEEQLLHNALHDRLTGLPNRALFMDRLTFVLGHAKGYVDYSFAVLFLDLDRFKVVNDSLGHIVGDQLLTAIALKLKRCMRPGDTVARFGGDEFTILLNDIKAVTEVTQVADRICKQLAAPFNLNGHEVFTTASIGIALSTTGYDRPEELLRDADIAMYRAKVLGKARYEVFDKDMLTSAVARLQLEMDLRRAIERQEFQLHYQPIVLLETGRITGFEALLRWRHPDRGLVSPAEFISVTEETGLILPIGQWVLHRACSQIYEWRQQLPMALPLTINVNLSGKQLSQPDLIEQIEQVLQETGLEASSLRLEITESVIIENAEAARSMCCKLRALGVQLQMDDFGTGYSSLSYLHRFPMDMLKIDRSFINQMAVSAENLEIVRTIILLAHSLGMKVTAEGVETAAQLAHLKAMGCDYGQGYFFSKPLDSDVAAALITKASILCFNGKG